MSQVVAERVFTAEDQARFAALSGDFNPMHVDAVAARRTGAGAAVVHGVHNLLWCLDAVAKAAGDVARVASLKVNFDTFVTVGEPVEAMLVAHDAGQLRAEVRVRGVTALTAVMAFGNSEAAVAPKPDQRIEPIGPIDLVDAMLTDLAGTVGFATPPQAAAALFPHAARLLGARRVAALGAFTRVVGMICPGLNSIFNRIALDSGADDAADDIGFRVTSVRLEHRRVVMAVWGGGWSGSLTTMMRPRPTVQPPMRDIAEYVDEGEFAGGVALVVGGSRGLGEAAAKIIAAGGGRPIVTYATGEADARRVSGEIRDWGGACEIMQLSIGSPIRPQLEAMAHTPNQLLYFATPMIGGRRTGLFDAERLELFLRFYVSGFYDCCRGLLDRSKLPLSALYPSSVFVEERPAGVTEYAMAKAAGEQLCHDMNVAFRGFHAVSARLPRLPTDQNPGLASDARHPAVTALLPFIRQLTWDPEG